MCSKIKPNIRQKDYSKYPFMNLSLGDIKGEKWKDVPRSDGYIKVSNFGRIWSLPRLVHTKNGKQYYTRERVRKQSIVKSYNSFIRDYREHLAVGIRCEGKEKFCAVNRLVYDRFVKPINSELWVVHKDGDNCNNKPDNLVLMNTTELYSHDLENKHRRHSFKTGKKRKPAII